MALLAHLLRYRSTSFVSVARQWNPPPAEYGSHRSRIATVAPTSVLVVCHCHHRYLPLPPPHGSLHLLSRGPTSSP